jgi:hypothetical protein
MIPVMTVLAATVPRFAAALFQTDAVVELTSGACRVLAPFVEESLDFPVLQASSAWTRWGMVVTVNVLEGTAAESVSLRAEPRARVKHFIYISFIVLQSYLLLPICVLYLIMLLIFILNLYGKAYRASMTKVVSIPFISVLRFFIMYRDFYMFGTR